MRMISALGLVAATFVFAPGGAEAARWCHEGARAQGCAFTSQTQCARAARRYGGSCHPQYAAQAPAPRSGMAPGQIYPSRPYWSSPEECFTDDGGGRFRPCSAGDAVQ